MLSRKTKEEWIGFQKNHILVIDKIAEKESPSGKYTKKCDILLVKCLLCNIEYEIESSSLIWNDIKSCKKCSTQKYKYIGKKQGKLTVLNQYHKRDLRGISQIWLECICECGNKRDLTANSFRHDKVICCKDCKSKYCKYILLPTNIKKYFKKITKRRDTIEFKITEEYIYQLLKSQNFKCLLSGLDISFEEGTASLDRIDSSKGYIEGNVQWVHRFINFMKQEMTQEDFLRYCKLVTINMNLI